MVAVYEKYMKVGDLVVHRDKLERGARLAVGIIVQITNIGSVFILWPTLGYKSGFNSYSFDSRFVVISEKN